MYFTYFVNVSMGKLAPRKRIKTNQVPILVVEDNADHWLIIRAGLKQAFPEVDPVWINYPFRVQPYLETCSTDAVKLPRMILLDLYLPKQEDGLAVLTALKSNLLYHKIPIVVLSQSASEEDRAESYECGAASYIVKPTTYHNWLECFYVLRSYWWEWGTMS